MMNFVILHLYLVCNDDKLRIHSNECTNEAVTKSCSKCVDKNACQYPL